MTRVLGWSERRLRRTLCRYLRAKHPDVRVFHEGNGDIQDMEPWMPGTPSLHCKVWPMPSAKHAA